MSNFRFVKTLEARIAELEAKNHELTVRFHSEHVIHATKQQIETATNLGKLLGRRDGLLEAAEWHESKRRELDAEQKATISSSLSLLDDPAITYLGLRIAEHRDSENTFRAMAEGGQDATRAKSAHVGEGGEDG